MNAIDLLIVGAGPAGMAAAVTARRHGLDVLVIDDQATPGGQIWRSVETVAATPRGARLGAAYRAGAEQASAFRASGTVYEPGSQLWQIEPGFRAFLTRDGKARTVKARAVILATGAQERPVPFPGWTLPGVLTVGAAQILLKTADEIPDKPVWIAGCGPLPLLYMTQLLAAGGKIAGFLDTTPRGRLRAALPQLPGAFRSLGDLAKGLAWTLALKRAGVPIIRHVTELVAEGEGRLQSLRYRTQDGREASVPAEVLLVHEGVVPSIHAPLALGCAIEWRAAQHCYAPVLDIWGETSQSGVFVAGDGAGIGGAKAAVLRGHLAALKVAVSLSRLGQAIADSEAGPLRGSLHANSPCALSWTRSMRRGRNSTPRPTRRSSAAARRSPPVRLRARAAIGRPGLNQIKAFTRAGHGAVPGPAMRLYGHASDRRGAAATRSEIGFYRIRPPLKPVTLGELASLDEREPVP
jgi:thioredoxin reductase